MLGAWSSVICERCVRADEDVVSYTDAVPKLHTTLYGHPIPKNHIVFDENLGIDIALRADTCAGQDDGELPDTCPLADEGALNVRKGVDKG